jgi:hypothetical protein
MSKKTQIEWIEGKFVSPHGEAAFVSIDKPTDKFGPETYEITVQWDKNDPAVKEWAKTILAHQKAYGDKIGKKIDAKSSFFKMGTSYDAENKQTVPDPNKIRVRFKLTPEKGVSPTAWPKYFKGVIDANGQPTTEPWGGDTIRVVFTLGGYSTALATGIKGYLKAIQVVERKGKPGNGGPKTAASWFDMDDTQPAAKSEDPFGDLPDVGGKDDTDDLL